MVQTGLVDKEIDGHTYSFEVLGAKESVKLMRKLIRLVGQPFAMLFTSAEGEGDLLKKKIKPDVLGLAVKALTENIDSDEVDAIIENLAATKCLCDGKKINFDQHYKQKLGHLINVVKAALEVQYGNFLAEVLSQLPSTPSSTNLQDQSPT